MLTFTGPTYDRLKFVAQVLLPVLGTLYFTLASIWELPAPEEVVGTIVALDMVLGVWLHISTLMYNKETGRICAGSLIVTELGDKKLFSLELEGDPEELETKKEVIFKVEKG